MKDLTAKYLVCVKLVVLLLCLCASNGFAQDNILKLNNKYDKGLIGKHISYLEDKSNNLSISEVFRSPDFQKSDKDIVNFNVSKSTFWLKFTIKNERNNADNVLEIAQPLLEELDFYIPDDKQPGRFKVIKRGQKYPFQWRGEEQTVNFMLQLDLAPGETKTYYARTSSYKQLLLPIRIIKSNEIIEGISTRGVWFGIYCGIVIVMFLYNIFIYFSTRDKSYFYYVLHTLFIGLTQISLIGFAYKYLWPNSPWFGNFSIYLFTCMVSIVGIQFLIEFMPIRKKTSPKIFALLKFFQVVYLALILLSLFGYYTLAFSQILNIQPIVAVIIISIAVYYYRLGYKEAKFYLIGWTSLMIGIVVYVLKDYGILPFNTTTAYAILFGSAAEITLLSFALADKINIFKREKEKSQVETLKALQENERIVRVQNVFLEQKVHERTQELERANETLNGAIHDLKEAQSQLVDAEKMAGLGQLTAGIAHEINNPINFVTSNIKPLSLDIKELNEVITMYENIDRNGDVDQQLVAIDAFKRRIDIKFVREEIKSLLSGIAEGAQRTAEIIRSLKNFSRLDESDTKPVDLNEGLDSTLVLIRSTFPSNLQVVKQYEDIPLVECLPGKINQVFMNLITNAVQAIKAKKQPNETEYLTVKTWLADQYIKISVKDSGTGMPEEIKQKIFEPFFTTKDVGEGTGLGLSIVFRIIENHGGNIEVITNINEGTEFIITLPVNSK